MIENLPLWASIPASVLLVLGGLLALTIALFMGAYFIQPITGTIITLKSLTLALMMILLIMSFVTPD